MTVGESIESEMHWAMRLDSTARSSPLSILPKSSLYQFRFTGY